MNTINYPYYSNNIFDEKINYSYSEFKGFEFIKAWQNSRNIFLEKIRNQNSEIKNEFEYFTNNDDKCATEILFDNWLKQIKKNELILDPVKLLLKRFEVTKRLFEEYDIDFRPINKEQYKNKILYLKFAYIISLIFQTTGKLQYLNTLLKLNDINCSFFDTLNENEKAILYFVLKNENDSISTLMKNLEISNNN